MTPAENGNRNNAEGYAGLRTEGQRGAYIFEIVCYRGWISVRRIQPPVFFENREKPRKIYIPF